MNKEEVNTKGSCAISSINFHLTNFKTKSSGKRISWLPTHYSVQLVCSMFPMQPPWIPNVSELCGEFMLLFFGIPKLLLRTLRFLQVFMNVYPVPLGIHCIYSLDIFCTEIYWYFVVKCFDLLRIWYYIVYTKKTFQTMILKIEGQTKSNCKYIHVWNNRRE